MTPMVQDFGSASVVTCRDLAHVRHTTSVDDFMFSTVFGGL
jgi:hypothetical protein